MPHWILSKVLNHGKCSLLELNQSMSSYEDAPFNQIGKRAEKDEDSHTHQHTIFLHLRNHFTHTFTSIPSVAKFAFETFNIITFEDIKLIRFVSVSNTDFIGFSIERKFSNRTRSVNVQDFHLPHSFDYLVIIARGLGSRQGSGTVQQLSHPCPFHKCFKSLIDRTNFDKDFFGHKTKVSLQPGT